MIASDPDVVHDRTARFEPGEIWPPPSKSNVRVDAGPGLRLSKQGELSFRPAACHVGNAVEDPQGRRWRRRSGHYAGAPTAGARVDEGDCRRKVGAGAGEGRRP